MKNLFLILYIFLITPAFSQNSQQPAELILRRVSDKLNSLETFQYDITRELNYASEDYHVISNWTCYFDFSLSGKPIEFAFQIEDPKFKMFYNGTEKFELNKSEKTIQVKANPGKEEFEGLSFLYNSIITLRNALPLIIADHSSKKSIEDVVINGHDYKLITVNIGKRRIQNLGEEFDNMQTQYNFIYEIMVDPDTYLPVEILQRNDLDKDFIRTNFANINLNPAVPNINSWYYSTYTNEFKPAESKARPKQLSRGSLAPEWKLKSYDDGMEVSLSDLKGKVVVIDFWIRNCGPCISSVPYLNELRDKYRNEDFELLSLNSYDSKEEIEKFVKKHNVKYPVLLNAGKITEEYGADSYPTLFIIDRSGKVIYSHSGFNKSLVSEIEKTIKNAL